MQKLENYLRIIRELSPKYVYIFLNDQMIMYCKNNDIEQSISFILGKCLVDDIKEGRDIEIYLNNESFKELFHVN